MQNNYDQIIQWVLEHEGLFTDEVTDPGGPTKFGITIWDIAIRDGVPASKLKRGNATWNQLREVVRNLTLQEAKLIYKTKYWDACRGDELPKGVDYSTVDFGINSGVSRSIKYLQRVVGVTDDGKLGPVTMQAILKADPKYVVNSLNDRRQAFLEGLGTFWKYGRGWTRRVKEVRARSLALING